MLRWTKSSWKTVVSLTIAMACASADAPVLAGGNPLGELQKSASAAAQRVGGVASSNAAKVQSTVSNAGKKISTSATGTRQQVQSTASSVAKKVGSTASSSARTANSTVSSSAKKVGGTVSSQGKAARGTVTTSGQKLVRTTTMTGQKLGGSLSTAGKYAPGSVANPVSKLSIRSGIGTQAGTPLTPRVGNSKLIPAVRSPQWTKPLGDSLKRLPVSTLPTKRLTPSASGLKQPVTSSPTPRLPAQVTPSSIGLARTGTLSRLKSPQPQVGGLAPVPTSRTLTTPLKKLPQQTTPRYPIPKITNRDVARESEQAGKVVGTVATGLFQAFFGGGMRGNGGGRSNTSGTGNSTVDGDQSSSQEGRGVEHDERITDEEDDIANEPVPVSGAFLRGN